jgi:hypothetical protein
MTHTESTPTTGSTAAPRIDNPSLREWLLADGEHVVRVERKDGGRTYRVVEAPAPGGVVDVTAEWTELAFVETVEQATAIAQANADAPQPEPQPTPFDERALDESDAILDMTGMAVTSTAAVLAIRAAVQYRADQAQARYLAAQHGSYEVGRGRAMVARDTWREALALVDTVIAERMS